MIDAETAAGVVLETGTLWQRLLEATALGFAGALLVRDQEQLRRLREAGPLEALAAVGVRKALENE